jgi:hypothetical protein
VARALNHRRIDQMTREANHFGFLIDPTSSFFENAQCLIVIYVDSCGLQNVERCGVNLFQIIFGQGIHAPTIQRTSTRRRYTPHFILLFSILSLKLTKQSNQILEIRFDRARTSVYRVRQLPFGVFRSIEIKLRVKPIAHLMAIEGTQHRDHAHLGA